MNNIESQNTNTISICPSSGFSTNTYFMQETRQAVSMFVRDLLTKTNEITS